MDMQVITSFYQDLKARVNLWHKKYENYLPAGFFFLGFTFDILTLGEVDDNSNIITLSIYLLAMMILMGSDHLKINFSESQNKLLKIIATYKVDIFHFMAGALLSAFTLFYFKSSSIANNFIFMFLMISLLILNELEIFKKQGKVLRTAITMLCLISYLIYLFPLIFGTSGPIIFYSSLILATFVSALSFYIMIRRQMDFTASLKELIFPHTIVCSLFLILYLFKIFPPIPLSLKYIGVFHDLQKDNGHYITYQETPSWKFWMQGDQDFVAYQGDKIFIFAKIFAPGGFEGKVYMRWIKQTKEAELTSDKIPMEITGGRKEGFRAFAYKENFTPGQWQVKVETKAGLEIGRINFSVTKKKKQRPEKPMYKRKW